MTLLIALESGDLEDARELDEAESAKVAREETEAVVE